MTDVVKVRTINPATEQTLDEYEAMTLDDINKVVEKARQSFKEWRNNMQKGPLFYTMLRIYLEKTRNDLLKL